MDLRPYQLRGVDAVFAELERVRAVLFVLATGGGKTACSVAIIARRMPCRALFLVHRRELLQQAAARLRDEFGHLQVGVIAPGHDSQPYAAIQVATVQTLLARDQRPAAQLIICDEAHHFCADVSWTEVLSAYPDAQIVGLTATPQRQDGQALGDVFQALVVAAQYSELIGLGHLVPCRVFQPPQSMGSDVALDPLTAYQRYGEDSLAFGFSPTVALAHQWAGLFRDAGIPSLSIDGKMAKRDRDHALTEFRAGRCRVLWNMNILGEGVDVPEARVLLNARKLEHEGAFLQVCGRVLRPAPDKADAIIIDLTGATLKHGFPTEDREYSLDGAGIKRSTAPCLRNCLQCGATLHAHIMQCTECGYRFAKRDPRVPHIYSMDLLEAYAGKATPAEAKLFEYRRLRSLAKAREYSPSWVQREYKKLFGDDIVVADATADERATELARLREIADKRGYKAGWAAFRYRAQFGSWPARTQHC
jgi:superfamily II DNA or RNA helicase